MSTVRFEQVVTLVVCSLLAATVHAQDNTGRPTQAPAIALTKPGPADLTVPDPSVPLHGAPYAQGIIVGGSVGGGWIRDKVMGSGGVGLEFHLGYFPLRWLGVVGSGSVFSHKVDDDRTLNFFGGALMAEVHPLDRLWLSAGPGYYSLALSVKKDEMSSFDSKTAKAFGGEADLGFDIYRATPPSGLSAGLVFRTQLTSIESQAVYTTLGLINVRWYGGGGAQTASHAAEAQTGAVPDRTGLSISSSCGEPVAAFLSVLQLGGHPCAYRVGDSGILPQLTGFAARLLKGTSYGVWLGKLTGVGNTVHGLSVRYDSAQSAIQLLHHGNGGVNESGLVRVAAGATQRWRIARTPHKALVWLNDQLVASEEASFEGSEAGLVTEGSEVELGQAERAPLNETRIRELEALAPVAWPAPVAPPPPVVLSPAEPSTPAEEPASAAPAADPHVTLLRSYYAGVSAGGFDASRYFAPIVVRYIGMRNTTPGAIQIYIDRTFPTQFKDATFSMEEASFKADGPGQFSYLEHAAYLNVNSGKYERLVSLVRVRFDDQGKLTHLWQDKVLERSASDGPTL